MKIRELLSLIGWDMRVNQGFHWDAIRAKMLLIEVRLEQFIYKNTRRHSNPLAQAIWLLCRGLGSVFQWWLCNALIAGSVELGRGLRLPHPQNIVIVQYATIGEFCLIYQNVTIAWNGFHGLPTRELSPRVGDCVLVATGATIIGNVTIGARTRIGAGSVVTMSIPENSVVRSPQPTVLRVDTLPNAVIPGSEQHVRDLYSIWK
jgi:serine O-acetyltransferase